MNAQNPFPGPVDIRGYQTVSSACSEIDQVQLWTGNFLKTVGLVSVPTVGWPLDFTLTYNSLETVLGPVGNLWRHSYMMHLTNPALHIIVFTAADGRQYEYASGTLDLSYSTFFSGQLSQVGVNWQILLPDGSSYLFDGVTATFGRLLQMVDMYGNVTTCQYNSSNMLVSVTEPTGRQLVFGYNMAGTLLTSVQDPNGSKILIGYDSNTNLNALTVQSATGQVGCSTTYSYTFLAGKYLLTQRTDANGKSYSYNYGNTSGTADYGLLTQVTDAESPSSSIGYDYKITAGGGVLENIGDGSSDETGHFLQAVLTDALGNQWAYTFDLNGNLWRVVDPLGHHRHFYWDQNQKLMYETGGYQLIANATVGHSLPGPRDNINNIFRRFAYDSTGTSPNVTSVGNLLYEVDASGILTAYTYDSASTYVNGSRRHMLSSYPGQANLAVQGNWVNTFGTQGYVLCAYNNGTDVVAPPSSYITSVTHDGTTSYINPTDSTQYTFLADPRVLMAPASTSLDRSLGYWQSATGATLNLTITMHQSQTFNLSLYTNSIDQGYYTVDTLYPLTSMLPLSLPNYAPIVYPEFSGRDLTFTVTDANGTQTFRITNNAPGAWITFPVTGGGSGSTITVQISPTTSGTYGINACISAVAFDPIDNHRTSYTYTSTTGDLASVSRVLTTGVNSTTTLTQSFTYNANGTLATATDENGFITHFFYEDAYFNLTRIQDALGNTMRFRYDKNGNVLSATDPNGHVWQTTYDAKNRPLSAIDPLQNTTLMVYDEVGNLTSATDPNGNRTQISYTNDNRPSIITDALSNQTTFQYDKAGNLLHVFDARSKEVTFTYDNAMRMTAVNWPNNDVPGSQQYAFDAIDRLRAITSPNGTQSTLSQILLDGGGNLLANPGAETPNFFSASTEPTPQNWAPTPATTSNKRVTSPTHNHSGASMQLSTTTGSTAQYWSQLNVVVPPGVNTMLQFFAQQDSSGNQAKVKASIFARQFDSTDPETASSSADLVLSATQWNEYSSLFSVPADSQYDRFTVPEVRAYGYSTAGTPTIWLDDFSLISLSSALSYDGEGRLSQIQTPDGSQATMVRDRFGRVTSWVDARGNTGQVGYDSLNRVTSFTDALGIDGLGNPVSGHVCTYVYDSVSNLVSTTDQNTNQTQYFYDHINRLTKIQYADASTELFGYDAASNLTSYTNNRSQTRTFSYDAANRLVKISYQTLNPVQLGYDRVGNLAFRIDSNGDLSRFMYDAINRLINTERANMSGATAAITWLESNTFDAVGNRTEFDSGVPTAPVYNNAGSQFGTPPSVDYATPTTAPFWAATSYNAANQLKGYTTPGALTSTLFTYDVESRCTNIAFPNSVSTVATYDIMGRLAAPSAPAGSPANYALLTTYGGTTRLGLNYGYDQNSNRIGQTVNSNGNLDGYDYVLDAANRLTNEDINRFVQRVGPQFAMGAANETDTSSGSGVTLLATTDTLTGTNIDNDRWRLVYAPQSIGYVGFEIRENNGLQMVFPRGFTNYMPGQTNAGQPTQDFPIARTVPYLPYGLNSNTVWGGTEHRTPLTGAFTVQVDFSAFEGILAGTPAKVALGIMVADTPLEQAMTAPTNAARVQIDSTPQYSVKLTVGGTLQTPPAPVATTDVSGGLQITRDSSGNLTFFRLVSGTWTQIGSTASSFTTNTLYVSLFLTTTNYGIGSGVFTNFSATSSAYPASGTFTSSVYDAGQAVTWNSIAWQGSFPTGTGVTYQIAVGDPTAGWTYVGHDGTTGTVFDSTHTTFDTPPSGRYASWQATLTGTGANTPTLTRVDVLYTGTNPSSTYTYAFDAAGNMTGKTAEVAGATTVTETRTVNNLNQITANTVVGSSTTNWTYSYDLSGNLYQRINTTLSQTTTYTWDENNRLTSVLLPSGATVSYTYDEAGRMLTRTDSAGTTSFVWDGVSVVQETDHAGNVTRYYSSPGSLVSFDINGTVYQAHADAIGSIRMITSSTGSIESIFSYDSWGNRLASTSDPLNFTYCFVGALGVRWDPATGLYYMRERWYDPGIGQFLSRDPIASANLYTYASCNPVFLSDPYGFAPNPASIRGSKEWCANKKNDINSKKRLLDEKHRDIDEDKLNMKKHLDKFCKRPKGTKPYDRLLAYMESNWQNFNPGLTLRGHWNTIRGIEKALEKDQAEYKYFDCDKYDQQGGAAATSLAPNTATSPATGNAPSTASQLHPPIPAPLPTPTPTPGRRNSFQFPITAQPMFYPGPVTVPAAPTVPALPPWFFPGLAGDPI